MRLLYDHFNLSRIKDKDFEQILVYSILCNMYVAANCRKIVPFISLCGFLTAVYTQQSKKLGFKGTVQRDGSGRN